jgi:PAS domain S-box-containing protein
MVVALSLLPLSAALLSGILVLVSAFGPRRRTFAVTYFMLLNITTFAWTLGYFFQMNWLPGTDLTLMRFGTPGYLVLVLAAIGASASPTYWFLFAAAASGRRFCCERRGILIAHIPLIYSLLVITTNPLHHLFSRPGVGPAGSVYGPLAPGHQFGTVVLVVGGVWMLASNAWSEGGRVRAALLTAAASMPLVGGLVWWTRDLTHLDVPVNPTTVLFPVFGAVLGYEVLRTGLGNIVPVTALRTIMDNTETCLAFLDPDFAFVSANSAYLKRVGRTEEEIVGKPYFSLFPDERRRVSFDEVRASRKPMTVRADRLSDETPATYWDWTLTPVVRGFGRVDGYVLSLVDVTETERQQELARTLNAVQAEVHSTMHLDRTIHAVLLAARAALETHCASVVLRRDGSWQAIEHCERVHDDWEPYRHGDLPHADHVLASGESLVAPSAVHDDRLDPYVMEALGYRSVISMPLFDGKGVVGVISFEDTRSRSHFAQAEVEFAERVGDAASRALQNARLYHAEHRIAATLQESMLSLPERIDHLEFAHLYRSATESALVGGDFYDIFEPVPGRVAVVIGDVSGKGIDAAVLTSLIKTTVRVHAYETPSPSDVMTRANEFLRQQFTLGVFATVFFGVLDTHTGELEYCSAGHPPGFLHRGSGVVQRLGGSDPIIGIFAGMPFSACSVRLGPSDTLLLYTDGLTEASGRTDRFGEERLEALLQDIVGGPNEIVGAVFEGVMAFTDNRLSDDLALLAVRLAAPQLLSRSATAS